MRRPNRSAGPTRATRSKRIARLALLPIPFFLLQIPPPLLSRWPPSPLGCRFLPRPASRSWKSPWMRPSPCPLPSPWPRVMRPSTGMHLTSKGCYNRRPNMLRPAIQSATTGILFCYYGGDHGDHVPTDPATAILRCWNRHNVLLLWAVTAVTTMAQQPQNQRRQCRECYNHESTCWNPQRHLLQPSSFCWNQRRSRLRLAHGELQPVTG